MGKHGNSSIQELNSPACIILANGYAGPSSLLPDGRLFRTAEKYSLAGIQFDNGQPVTEVFNGEAL
jgi:hypothetical protein